jgi:hypothetical protein
MRSGRYPRDFWKGFAILLPLYALLQLIYFLPESALPDWMRVTSLSPVWFLLVPVYLTGWWILRRSEAGWLSVVWHIVHISLVGFALSVLAFGRIVKPLPEGIALSVRPIVEFLISPILYLALGLLYRAARFERR